VPVGFVFHTVLYAVLYTVSVLGAAVFIFSRREFK